MGYRPRETALTRPRWMLLEACSPSAHDDVVLL